MGIDDICFISDGAWPRAWRVLAFIIQFVASQGTVRDIQILVEELNFFEISMSHTLGWEVEPHIYIQLSG